MAGRQGNKAWLRQQLKKTLQWDDATSEAVVEAVVAAGSNREELDGLVEAYMGGHPTARQLVQQFCGLPAANMHMHHRHTEPSTTSSVGSRSRNGGGARPGTNGDGRPQTMELLPPADKTKQPVLNMGRNIRTTIKPARKKTPGAGSSSGGDGAAGGVQPGGGMKQVARPVVNCLRCGKIYDCRLLSDEAMRFLGSGGICSFCGNRVALRYADGTTNAPASNEDDAAGTTSCASADSATTAAVQGPCSIADAEPAGFKAESQQGNAPSSVAYNDSAAAAVALKDRLVQYDRESAKRTTVLDDQSDFFEIDANCWLSNEERAVLKQREQELAEAEEARRRQVTVTFDLLGRKVILDGSQGESGGGSGEKDAAALAAQLDTARAAAAARAATAAAAAEAAQGGGAAAPTALAAVDEKLRGLRITVNPSMAARHFVFLPQQQQPHPPEHHQQWRQHQQAAVGPAAASARPARQVPGSSTSSRGGQRPQHRRQDRLPVEPGFSRLQHDDPFELGGGEGEVELMAASG